MPELSRDEERAIRERAYLIWEREGRPEGRAAEHWRSAVTEGSDSRHDRDDEFLDDEEKVLAGRSDANIPALLTKDVRGG
jgi:Protein of unknown function (DUF2934)